MNRKTSATKNVLKIQLKNLSDKSICRFRFRMVYFFVNGFTFKKYLSTNQFNFKVLMITQNIGGGT